MHQHFTASRADVPLRRFRYSLLAFALACLTLLAGLTWLPQSAHAAGSWGAGGFGWSSNGTWLGNFVAANGTRVYCVDLHESGIGSGGDEGSIVDTVSASGGGAGGGTRALSGSDLRMINYAVSVHGQTNDDVTAAAVAAYVWNFTSTNHRGNGAHYIGGPRAAEIHERYAHIKADAEAHAHEGSATGAGSLTFTTDPENHYQGELFVSARPANSLGTVTLSNGVFADTGSATRNGVRDGDVYAVQGVAPEDGSNYRIRAVGEFSALGSPVFHENVRLHTDSAQRTAGPGTSESGLQRFSANGEDSTERTSSFVPTVGTQVASTFVQANETLKDVVTFRTAAAAGGANNNWYRSPSGEYAPVTAHATIYGPFLSQPLETDEPPVNAPVAWSGIQLTTSTQDGPTVEYTVDSGFAPTEAGFYTWVWQILASDLATAPIDTRAFLPTDYSYRDRFGQIAETSISPTKVAISTQLSEHEVGIGETVTDDVTLAVYGGGWLQQGGARVPATLIGTAYYLESQPHLSEDPPAEAEVVGTLQLEFNGDGTLTSAPLKLPLRAGYVTFQWCLSESDQPEEFRGLLAESCDKFGQGSETVRLMAPTVSTLAVPDATPGAPFYDTAVVDGPVPAGVSLVFDLYEQMDGTQPAHCDEQNLVSSSAPVPVPPGVKEFETYRSPEVTVDREGTYWWVESLVHTDSDSGETTLLHRGECGIANETTTVRAEVPPPTATPPVPTESPKASPGQLAQTGDGSARYVLASSALMLALAASAFVAAHRLRSRKSRSSAGQGLAT